MKVKEGSNSLFEKKEDNDEEKGNNFEIDLKTLTQMRVNLLL